jgi:hypothetical protein
MNRIFVFRRQICGESAANRRQFSGKSAPNPQSFCAKSCLRCPASRICCRAAADLIRRQKSQLIKFSNSGAKSAANQRQISGKNGSNSAANRR